MIRRDLRNGQGREDSRLPSQAVANRQQDQQAVRKLHEAG
jgi:hypothetical protein